MLLSVVLAASFVAPMKSALASRASASITCAEVSRSGVPSSPPPSRARLFSYAVPCVALAAAWRPMLAAQVAYIALGVGIGFGSTKFVRFYFDGWLQRAYTELRLRERMRALALRIDPSLAETEGATLSWRDLAGPKLPGLPGLPKPPKPPWARKPTQ